MVYFAGLSNINADLFDAAKVDGANWRQQFFFVIIPSLNVIIVLVTTLVLIADFRYMFGYVFNLTRGGGLDTLPIRSNSFYIGKRLTIFGLATPARLG